MALGWLNEIAWTPEGLVPAIAQDASSGEVLMLAWMSRESLQQTLLEGCAVYWSRSRAKLWKKGEHSGHTQLVRHIRLDCDGDTLLLSVEQLGGIACHTGRRRCFYRQLEGDEWLVVEQIVKEPSRIYAGKATDAR